MAGEERKREERAAHSDMKVGTRYNSRNYAGAYYAQAKKKTGNASAPLLRLREVVHEEEAETRDARKGRPPRSYGAR